MLSVDIRALNKEYDEGIYITDVRDSVAGKGSSYPHLP
jgi:hypothetical protein